MTGRPTDVDRAVTRSQGGTVVATAAIKLNHTNGEAREEEVDGVQQPELADQADEVQTRGRASERQSPERRGSRSSSAGERKRNPTEEVGEMVTEENTPAEKLTSQRRNQSSPPGSRERLTMPDEEMLKLSISQAMGDQSERDNQQKATKTSRDIKREVKTEDEQTHNFHEEDEQETQDYNLAPSKYEAATQSKGRLPEIPKFLPSGLASELEDWEIDLRLWMTISRINTKSREAVSWLGLAMKGAAHKWYNWEIARNIDKDQITFDEVIDRLKEKFVTVSAQRDSYLEFLNLRQDSPGKPRMNVDEFAVELERLAMQSTSANVTSSQLRIRFIEGLDTKLVSRIYPQIENLETIAYKDLTKLASKQEVAMYAVRKHKQLAAAGIRQSMYGLLTTRTEVLQGRSQENSRNEGYEYGNTRYANRPDRNNFRKGNRVRNNETSVRFEGQRQQPDATSQRNQSAGQNHSNYKKNSIPGNNLNENQSRSPASGSNTTTLGVAKKQLTAGQRLTNSTKKELTEAGACYICAKQGHYAYECPEKQTGPRHMSAMSRSYQHEYSEETERELTDIGRCWHCGRHGHVTELCQTITQNGEREGMNISAISNDKKERGKEQQKIIARNSASAPRKSGIHTRIIQEVLINGISARALIDTGSTHTFVANHFAEIHNVKTTAYEDPVTVSLGFRGTKGKINRHANVKLSVQGKILSYASVEIASVEGNLDAVIGIDVLSQMKIVIDTENRAIISGMSSSQINAKPELKGKEQKIKLAECSLTKQPKQKAKPNENHSVKEINLARAKLCADYQDVMPINGPPEELPPLRIINHSIPLIDESLILKKRIMHIPDSLKPVLRIFEQKMEASGKWERRQALSTVPLFVKAKPDGKGIRPLFSLEERNKNTHQMRTPLPEMKQIIKDLSAAKYMSAMDVSGAYEQMRIVPEDVHKTAFTTPSGTKVSHVMQQGDCNAPSSWQSLMNELFNEEIGISMHVYIDDIFIFSNTYSDHVRTLRRVLEILRTNKIYLSPKKVHLFATEIKALGHIVTAGAKWLDPTKAEAITSFPVPRNQKDVQAFAGLTNWVSEYFPRLATIAGPYTDLVGNVPFLWTRTCQQAFDKVKEMVKEASKFALVSIVDSELAGVEDSEPWLRKSPATLHEQQKYEEMNGKTKKKFIFLQTDASLVGVGGKLTIGTYWWNAKPVGFFSKKFTKTQRNYSVHDLELLALVEGLKFFEDQLLGRLVYVLTDNSTVASYVKPPKKPSPRHWRQREYMNNFNLRFTHIQGVHNHDADALSRKYENQSESYAPEGYVTMDKVLSGDGNEHPMLGAITRHAKAKEIANIVTSKRVRIPTEKALNEQLKSVVAKKDKRKVNTPKLDLKNNNDKQESERMIIKMHEKNDNIIDEESSLRESEDAEKLNEPLTAKSNVDVESVPEKQLAAEIEKPQAEESGGVVEVLKQVNLSHETDPMVTQSRRMKPVKVKAPKRSKERQRRLPKLDVPASERLIAEPRVSWQKMMDAGVQSAMKDAYAEDPFFKKVLAQKDIRLEQSVYKLIDGFILCRRSDQEKMVLGVPQTTINGLDLRTLLITEVHTKLAHPGYARTLKYIQSMMFWPGMSKLTEEICSGCQKCQNIKAKSGRSAGLLHPMPHPVRPWASVGMDFVGPLPLSEMNGAYYDMLFVVIDRFTSMTHLIPTTVDATAEETAELFFHTVYKLHGLPDDIVSDRDVKFTSDFWTHLMYICGTDLKMSSAYHPQSDGATERMNKTINTVMSILTSNEQLHWVRKLPIAEFAINSRYSRSTGYSPFEANYGYLPKMMPSISDLTGIDGVNFEAKNFALKAEKLQNEISENYSVARLEQSTYANRRRIPEAEFGVGDKVWLSAKNLPTPQGEKRKWSARYFGPYEIISCIPTTSTYQLNLPKKFGKTHNVFHSSLLRIHKRNNMDAEAEQTMRISDINLNNQAHRAQSEYTQSENELGESEKHSIRHILSSVKLNFDEVASNPVNLEPGPEQKFLGPRVKITAHRIKDGVPELRILFEDGSQEWTPTRDVEMKSPAVKQYETDFKMLLSSMYRMPGVQTEQGVQWYTSGAGVAKTQARQNQLDQRERRRDMAAPAQDNSLITTGLEIIERLITGQARRDETRTSQGFRSQRLHEANRRAYKDRENFAGYKGTNRPRRH